MTNATQLTKNVIESEILHMESQKLLVRDGDYVALSELSKNILMISKSVKMLNAEKKILCFNLITGEIEGFDKNIINDIGQDDLVMEGKIRSGEIVGISIEDNVSFFADYMSAFDGFSEEQIDKILSSIYLVIVNCRYFFWHPFHSDAGRGRRWHFCQLDVFSCL